MKRIFKYLGILLSVVLLGVFSSCKVEEPTEPGSLALGIKVFFPTKVVAGQPMTINGSGFAAATEIVFPGDIVVKDFKIVSDEMIRVTAPAGIKAEGGKLIVRTAGEEVESRLPLTLGKTVISGYSRQEGESVTGGEQITIYGTDLEFINFVELLDADGNPNKLEGKDFYRKGTSSVIFTVPRKNVFEGTFAGKVGTFDGLEFTMPELAYTPAKDAGHWEKVKTILWENESGEAIPGWGGKFRFSNEQTVSGEQIYAFPMDVWSIIKDGTFRIAVDADGSSNIRITTGWWTGAYGGADHNCLDMVQEDEDGTKYIELNIKEDGNLYDNIDAQHLLFTGDAYTLLEIYVMEWVEGGGGGEKPVVFWENDGSYGAIEWNGTYRFALDGNDGLNECIATFPADVWNIIKTGTFYLEAKGSDWVQMRITDGWWSTTWTGSDITTGDERIIDNGDGTYYIEINFGDDPLVNVLDAQHLLFTGGGYTPLKLYYYE